jgi:Raf kinase inhibitor-like YbhB/YbcL family protein
MKWHSVFMWKPFVALSASLLAVIAVGCQRESTTAPAIGSPRQGGNAMQFQLLSDAFDHDTAIPRKYTGEGDDVSPALAWENPPAGTQSFALVCDDPDAPTPKPWVHWVIYGIGANVAQLPKGVPAGKLTFKAPIEAKQGKNSWDSGATVGYRGPMPPPGHGRHHYHFKLYALDAQLDLEAGATKEQLLAAMKGHVLAEAVLIGTYERR